MSDVCEVTVTSGSERVYGHKTASNACPGYSYAGGGESDSGFNGSEAKRISISVVLLRC